MPPDPPGGVYLTSLPPPPPPPPPPIMKLLPTPMFVIDPLTLYQSGVASFAGQTS